MKFLCLHGKGTSAKIMASQTSTFRRKLDPSFEFDFVDGLMTSTPAPDIPLFYSPPYYAWWEAPHSIEDQKKAHKWLKEKCEKDGPYDGVLMFSQGCALMTSFLLYHYRDTPNAPLPFKVVIFMCGGIPLNVAEDVGIHVSNEAREWDEISRKGLLEKTTTVGNVKRGEDRWANTGPLVFDTSKKVELDNIYGLDLSEDNLPDFLKVKGRRGIQLPSVHIFGSKDPRYPQSLQLAHLFDEKDRRVFDHESGHDIPRTKDVSESIAELIEWSALKSYGLAW